MHEHAYFINKIMVKFRIKFNYCLCVILFPCPFLSLDKNGFIDCFFYNFVVKYPCALMIVILNFNIGRKFNNYRHEGFNEKCRGSRNRLDR